MVARILFSAVHYPANYGFVPRTYCDDGDPLDILVLCSELIQPLAIMRAKVIGVMKMRDDKYKALENKKVLVGAPQGRSKGLEVLRDAIKLYDRDRERLMEAPEPVPPPTAAARRRDDAARQGRRRR